MRMWMIPLASLAILTTPAAAETRSVSSVGAPACAANLQKLEGAAGYKIVRNCANASAAKSGAAVAVSREPVVDGSALSGQSLFLAILAFLTATTGGLIAFDVIGGGDGDNAGGLDPASP